METTQPTAPAMPRPATDRRTSAVMRPARAPEWPRPLRRRLCRSRRLIRASEGGARREDGGARATVHFSLGRGFAPERVTPAAGAPPAAAHGDRRGAWPP